MRWIGLSAIAALLTSFGAVQRDVGSPAPETWAAPGRIAIVLDKKAMRPSLEPAIRDLGDRGLAVSMRELGDGKLYLVDEQGIIRRRAKVPSFSAGLVAFAADWELGRGLFLTRCARCHGDDGMDTGYPFIEQLGGIGRRWSMAEMRAKLNPTGAQTHPILVRGDQFSKREFEGLLIFLAGL